MANLKMSNLEVLAQSACYHNQIKENSVNNCSNTNNEDTSGFELLAEAAFYLEKIKEFNKNKITNNDDNKIDDNGKLTAFNPKKRMIQMYRAKDQMPAIETSSSLNKSNKESSDLSEINSPKSSPSSSFEIEEPKLAKRRKISEKSSKLTENSKPANSTRSKRKSSIASSLIINKEDNKLKEFIKSVSIKPKNEDTKLKIDLNDDIFDENTKIQVRTPKSTYTLSGLRTRQKATKTPDELKTQEFYLKRKKNNSSAKKSRENKNLAIRATELKVELSEQEQLELEFEIGKEIMIMKCIQEKLNNEPKLKEQFMEQIQNQQLNYFAKVF